MGLSHVYPAARPRGRVGLQQCVHVCACAACASSCVHAHLHVHARERVPCAFVCAHVCVHVGACAVCMPTCACLRTRGSMCCVCARVPTCMSAHVRTHASPCVRVRLCLRVPVRACVCTSAHLAECRFILFDFVSTSGIFCCRVGGPRFGGGCVLRDALFMPLVSRATHSCGCVFNLVKIWEISK